MGKKTNQVIRRSMSDPLKKVIKLENQYNIKNSTKKIVNTNIDDFIKLVEGYQTISGKEADYQVTEEEIFERIKSIDENAINEDNAQSLINSFNKMACKYYKLRKLESRAGDFNRSGFFRALDVQLKGKIDKFKKDDINVDVKFSKLLNKQYYSNVLEPLNEYEGDARKNMKRLWGKCADIIIAKARKNPNIGNVGIPQMGYSATGTVPPPSAPGGVPLPPPPPPPPAPPMLGTMNAGPTTKKYYEQPDNLSRWQRLAFNELPDHGGKKSPAEFSVDELIDFAKNREQIRKKKLQDELKSKRDSARKKMKKLPKYKGKSLEDISDDEVDAYIEEQNALEGKQRAELADAFKLSNEVRKLSKKYSDKLKLILSEENKLYSGMNDREIMIWVKDQIKKDKTREISDEELRGQVLFLKVSEIIENKTKQNVEHLSDDIKSLIKEKGEEITEKDVFDFVMYLIEEGKIKINDSLRLSLGIHRRALNLNMHAEENNNNEW